LPLDVDKVGKLKGIVLGFIIGILLATFWVSIKKVLSNILN
jgi:tetrahydromethanopterin S-methyltransferase subunit G